MSSSAVSAYVWEERGLDRKSLIWGQDRKGISQRSRSWRATMTSAGPDGSTASASVGRSS